MAANAEVANIIEEWKAGYLSGDTDQTTTVTPNHAVCIHCKLTNDKSSFTCDHCQLVTHRKCAGRKKGDRLCTPCIDLTSSDTTAGDPKQDNRNQTDLIQNLNHTLGSNSYEDPQTQITNNAVTNKAVEARDAPTGRSRVIREAEAAGDPIRDGRAQTEPSQNSNPIQGSSSLATGDRATEIEDVTPEQPTEAGLDGDI